MPYFFIIPAFVLFALALLAAAIVSRFSQPLASIRPYLWSVLLWSTAGFALSTILYAVIAFAGLAAIKTETAETHSTISGVAGGLLIFVAPFLTASIGVFGGIAFAIWRTRRKLSSGGAARAVGGSAWR